MQSGDGERISEHVARIAPAYTRPNRNEMARKAASESMQAKRLADIQNKSREERSFIIAANRGRDEL